MRRLPVGELTWSDLVVEPDVASRLGALADLAVAGGLTVLVHGAAGVGKTFATRVWAESMRVDLWRVDSASLLRRHAGATGTRGLEEVFAYGERPHAILLFHDAEALAAPGAGDALAMLVARASGRRAPTVLETRDPTVDALRDAVGEHVAIVGLGFPDAGLRRTLWERLVLRASPLSRPDLDALAALELPGASIDAAVRAVVLEHGDERLTTESLLAAARSAPRC